jgi:hypothetical protein
MFETELADSAAGDELDLQTNDMPEFQPATEIQIGDENLRDLLEKYESLKDKMDALQAERNVLREDISEKMVERDLEYSEVPVPSGRAYRVSLTSRMVETVTREGKSFIKVHATPELLESLIKSSERETLAIRELTGVPKQSLFNKLNDGE